MNGELKNQNLINDLTLKIERAESEREAWATISESHCNAKKLYVEALEKQLQEIKAKET